MYICVFSRSDGAGSAMTRNTRGLTRSVRTRIVPPLPAVSRPSNKMMARWPSRLTHSCNSQSSACSLRSFFVYSLFFSFDTVGRPSRTLNSGGPRATSGRTYFRSIPRGSDTNDRGLTVARAESIPYSTWLRAASPAGAGARRRGLRDVGWLERRRDGGDGRLRGGHER